MALPKFTFGVPLLKTVEYFSVCPECQQEHSTSANGGAKPNALFKFSGNANDVKYDIIKHAIDEMDAAKLTGIDVTRDHVARTWRAKVVKECGQDSGCAKLLLAQDGSKLEKWLAEQEKVLRPNPISNPPPRFSLTAPKRKAEVDEARKQNTEEPTSKRHQVQQVMEPGIKSALRAATTSQLLGHVPLAVTPASGSAVAPRGKNHAKNQHKLKLKKAKKDAAAAQQETSFQAAAQQETDAEQESTTHHESATQHEAITHQEAVTPEAAAQQEAASKQDATAQQEKITEHEAATPQESVIQPEAATSISDPGIAALGDLQQALQAAPYHISSEWEIENSARFSTLASFLTATPFELAIRKQK